MPDRTGKPARNVLVPGGMGFFGAHLAARFLATSDAQVTVVDDLIDPGALRNIEWLKSQAAPGRLSLVRGASRSMLRLADAASQADEIYFLAGPGSGSHRSLDAVSLVLEAARRSGRTPALICASACGSIGDPQSASWYPEGNLAHFAQTERLVHDFAGLHHLPAVTLEMDTVTGPRRFDESSDWVARLEYSILGGRRCRVVADASEPHDVLHVSDAVQALLAARAYLGKTAGKRYRVHGGAAHVITVGDMVQLIERVCHRHAKLDTPWRKGGRALPSAIDDPQFSVDTAWMPRRSLEETVREIAAFWHVHRDAVAASQPLPATSRVRLNETRRAADVPVKAA
ncbi:NAD-dependent epimerase/dehydratase family protein [Acidobacteria bacterium AB60]|nr:NAD-dependent epimerase/dehydratase family protein [Acidobacteria bacterium AB60]